MALTVTLFHYFFLIFWMNNSLIFTLKKLILYLGYGGPAAGVLIAYKLFKMESLTFLNKMFLFLFSVDSIFGFIQTFCLEKLQKEKWVSNVWKSWFHYVWSSMETDHFLQKQNCYNVISLWMLSTPGKAKYYLGMIFCRYKWNIESEIPRQLMVHSMNLKVVDCAEILLFNFCSYIFTWKILLCSICKWPSDRRIKVASLFDFLHGVCIPHDWNFILVGPCLVEGDRLYWHC